MRWGSLRVKGSNWLYKNFLSIRKKSVRTANPPPSDPSEPNTEREVVNLPNSFREGWEFGYCCRNWAGNLGSLWKGKKIFCSLGGGERIKGIWGGGKPSECNFVFGGGK